MIYFDLIFLIVYMFLVPKFLHIMQQESYQNDGMFRWIIKNPRKAFGQGIIQMAVVVITYILTGVVLLNVVKNANGEVNPLYRYYPTFISLFALVVVNGFFAIKEKIERKKAKKPLKFTARAIRLLVSNFVIACILEAFILDSIPIFYPSEIKDGVQVYNQIKYYNVSGDVIPQEINEWAEYSHTYDLDAKNRYISIIYAFVIFGLPLNMIISNWFVSPVESWNNDRYKNKARRILNKKEYKNLIRIGITGSYGKTSTKHILATILSEKYNVLYTPGSYNTSMGNVKVIREQLKPEHEVFISEMGARKRLDVFDICSFVRPNIGIITSIGEQHLETFKNIENVKKTKAEILAGTTFDGAIFLPENDERCLDLYNKNPRKNKYLYSTVAGNSDVYASDIKTSKDGSEFKIHSKKLGTYSCKTVLLGMHNVQNIVCAVAVAEYLGLSKEQIVEGIRKTKPVEHRLQLLPSTNGTTVIDDAFNSNPVGSKYALDVLSTFEGRKIIITPGMVELGKEEYNLNKEFGKQMARVVDIAILVGNNRAKPIEEGLKEEGFNDMNIYVVNSLDEATKRLAKLTKAGDVIIFENDLPDSYNE